MDGLVELVYEQFLHAIVSTITMTSTDQTAATYTYS